MNLETPEDASLNEDKQTRDSKSLAHRRGRWWRFSLARLMLTVGLSAILTLYYVRIYRDKVTTQWLIQSRARFTLIDPTKQSIGQRFQGWCGNSLPAIDRLMIDQDTNVECIDELLKVCCTRLPNLYQFRVNHCAGFHDRHLKMIGASNQLKSLRLSETAVTSAGMQSLRSSALRELWLVGQDVDDRWLVELPTLAGLTHLTIMNHYLGHGKITDQGLGVLVEKFPRLEVCLLLGQPITDAGLASLLKLEHLQVLELSNSKISDQGLSTLALLPKLTRLDISRTDISSRGIAALSKLKGLQELDLTGTKIDDQALPHLMELKGLKRLYIYDTKLSAEGVSRLKESLPKTEVVNTLVIKLGG